MSKEDKSEQAICLRVNKQLGTKEIGNLLEVSERTCSRWLSDHPIDLDRRRLIKKEEYEINPQICKRCEKPIELRERSVIEVRRLQFCDHTCSAIHSNTHKEGRNGVLVGNSSGRCINPLCENPTAFRRRVESSNLSKA